MQRNSLVARRYHATNDFLLIMLALFVGIPVALSLIISALGIVGGVLHFLLGWIV